jgi:hypothetical protein
MGLAFGTLLLCCMLAPASKADEWNKMTKVTFHEGVEIPGQILPPGTYVFQLADSPFERHRVEVWNADQDDLLAILFTTPSERPEPTDLSVFEFEERPGNSPMALQYWYYPGDLIGEGFTY